MEGVEAKFRKTVKEYHMLEPGDRVIAAVSGGADSVCLLALLKEMRASLKLCLRAVHVHHGLREGEADRDAEFVSELCSALGVPCHIIRVDVRKLAEEKGMSEEEAGRYLRYEAFEREAAAWEEEEPEEGPGLVRVAVAHQRDDQAETILHNMFRGSGLHGLRGIPYVRGRIIRPLLDEPRGEILQWLSEKGLSFVEDSTNSEGCYTRNRIRSRILPQIESEVNQGAVGNILRLGRLADQADQYLREQADLWIKRYVRGGEPAVPVRASFDGGQSQKLNTESLGEAGDAGAEGILIPAKEFLAQPEIIRSYIVLELLKTLSGHARNLGERHVQQVLELFLRPVGRKVKLPYYLTARKEYEGVFLGFSFFEGKQRGFICPQVKTRIFSCEKGAEFPKKMYTKWFDYDKIKDTPVVRTRQTGDFITLSDGKTKTVKRFMIDEKIPRQMRDEIPLLADGSHVMWIMGYRISQFYKIEADTKRIFEACAIYPAKEVNNNNGG